MKSVAAEFHRYHHLFRYMPSPKLISSRQTIEAGVGLIACNLPTLGLFWGQSIPEHLRRGWHLSAKSMRNAAQKISTKPTFDRSTVKGTGTWPGGTRLESKTGSESDRTPPGNGTGSRSSRYLWRSKSAVVQIPLINVAVRSEDDMRRGSARGDERSERETAQSPESCGPAVKGFDAV